MDEQPSAAPDRQTQPGRAPAKGQRTAETATEPAGPAPSEYFFAGIIATGVAAVVAAIGTSFTGLQGTAVGALIGAMVGSIVSEMTRRQLSRLERRARARLLMAQRRGLPDPDEFRDAIRRAGAALRARLPARVLLTVTGLALGGFIAALAVVSAIELIAGRPLSAIETGQPTPGTTVGHLVGSAPSRIPSPPSVVAPAPSTEPSPVAAPSPGGAARTPNVRPAISPQPAPAISASAVSSPETGSPEPVSPTLPASLPTLTSPSSSPLVEPTPSATPANG